MWCKSFARFMPAPAYNLKGVKMKTLTSLEVQEVSGGYAAPYVEIRLPSNLPIIFGYGAHSVGGAGRDYMSVFTRAAR